MTIIAEKQWYKFSGVRKKTIADILLSELAAERGLSVGVGIQGSKNCSRAIRKDISRDHWLWVYIGLEYDRDSVFFRFEWNLRVGVPDNGGIPDCEQLINVFFEQLRNQALEVVPVDFDP